MLEWRFCDHVLKRCNLHAELERAKVQHSLKDGVKIGHRAGKGGEVDLSTCPALARVATFCQVKSTTSESGAARNGRAPTQLFVAGE